MKVQNTPAADTTIADAASIGSIRLEEFQVDYLDGGTLFVQKLRNITSAQRACEHHEGATARYIVIGLMEDEDDKVIRRIDKVMLSDRGARSMSIDRAIAALQAAREVLA